MGDVMVLHAAQPGQVAPDDDDAWLERLPYAYRLVLERRDAASRAASRQALLLLAEGVRRLRGVALDHASLRFPEGGKPSLANGPCFSVTHCSSRVAVALGEQFELGIDVEDRANTRAGCTDLGRWTAIEASLKTVGKGLRHVGAVDVPADLAFATVAGRRLHLRRLELSPDCVATLASVEPVERVWLEEVPCGHRE